MNAGTAQKAQTGLPLRALSAIALAAILLVLSAVSAFGYEIGDVSIHAIVRADGSLAVTETRAFEFDEDVNGAYWTIPASVNAQGEASSVTVDGVSIDDGEGAQTFASVPSATEGDAGVYTVEQSADGTTIKVFSPHEDGQSARVTVSYTEHGAIMAWADTAELYWKFVGEEWEEDSPNVSLTVEFEGASAGDAATVGENFCAWAHGPLDGTVSLDAASSTVTCSVPVVRSGQFAEVRVAFPTSWVPELSVVDEQRLPDLLDEEEAWAEEANAQRERARTELAIGTAAQVLFALALLTAALVIRFTRGRNPKPVFEETYFRDVPSADHPAVIAAFMEDGTVSNRAFISTLMKLTDDRVIALDVEQVQKDGLLGSKTEDEYRMRLLNRAAASDPIDRAALTVYFGNEGSGVEETGFKQIEERAKRDASAMGSAMDDFKAEVSAALESRLLVLSDGSTVKFTFIGLGVLLLLGSLFFQIHTDFACGWAMLIVIACAVGSFIAAVTYCVYTQEGVELRARCVALKRWLEDFTRLGEAVPDDLILWNKLLVMAVALGVSDTVLRELADAVPADRRQDGYGGYYYPLYWWCYPHGRLGAPTREVDNLQTASFSSLAESAGSSGGGFGGGFSAGGGGGVGGGGGGTF